jgi:cytidylate kinase
MPRTVICVSGSDGAGGEEVARLVANRLGLRYISEDIVSDAARRAGVGSGAVADVEQRKSLIRRWLDELG